MMKKLLVLILVLAMASLANATVTLELRESDGVTVISGSALDNLLVGSDYVLVLKGLATDIPKDSSGFGIYGSTYTSADWAHLGPGDATTTKVGTGNMTSIEWSEDFQGYEAVVYDSAYPSGITSGDWFKIALSGIAAGTFSLDLQDYDNDSAVISNVSGTVVVPEPITIALLGLGGLFLRRRK